MPEKRLRLPPSFHPQAVAGSDDRRRNVANGDAQKPCMQVCLRNRDDGSPQAQALSLSSRHVVDDDGGVQRESGSHMLRSQVCRL